MSSTTGALPVTGTPTAAGTSAITVTVTDSATAMRLQTASVSWTLTVSAPALKLSGGTLSSGTVGVAYSATVTASGEHPRLHLLRRQPPVRALTMSS